MKNIMTGKKIKKRGDIMHIYIPVGLIVGGYKLYKKHKHRR